jgi:hypothetical protein
MGSSAGGLRPFLAIDPGKQASGRSEVTDRPDCQRRLMIGRRCLLRCLWGRGFRCRGWRSGFRCWCGGRRSGFWGRYGRWSRRRWRGLRSWRRRRSRCWSFSLWQLDLRGLALVPVHEIGSNDESEHDASQDDSEERPTAGLVVVCHVVDLHSRVSFIQIFRRGGA